MTVAKLSIYYGMGMHPDGIAVGSLDKTVLLICNMLHAVPDTNSTAWDVHFNWPKNETGEYQLSIASLVNVTCVGECTAQPNDKATLVRAADPVPLALLDVTYDGAAPQCTSDASAKLQQTADLL